MTDYFELAKAIQNVEIVGLREGKKLTDGKLKAEVKILSEALQEIAALRGGTIRTARLGLTFDDGCEEAFGRCAGIALNALAEAKRRSEMSVGELYFEDKQPYPDMP